MLAGVQLGMALPGPVLEHGVVHDQLGREVQVFRDCCLVIEGCGDQERLGGDGAQDDDLCDVEGLLSRIMS